MAKVILQTAVVMLAILAVSNAYPIKSEDGGESDGGLDLGEGPVAGSGADSGGLDLGRRRRQGLYSYSC